MQQYTESVRVINIDRNAAYPVAMETLKGNEMLPETTELWQVKYLNTVVEQDPRTIKRITRAMVEFKSFNSARRILRSRH
ncbi:DDE-type integrase/transposase/recombinase [Phormidium tenue FACHB-886]|nr:DDE-type integrase/transposase/recombinase [Phormidium tenue FACHB-886]